MLILFRHTLLHSFLQNYNSKNPRVIKFNSTIHLLNNLEEHLLIQRLLSQGVNFILFQSDCLICECVLFSLIIKKGMRPFTKIVLPPTYEGSSKPVFKMEGVYLLKWLKEKSSKFWRSYLCASVIYLVQEVIWRCCSLGLVNLYWQEQLLSVRQENLDLTTITKNF